MSTPPDATSLLWRFMFGLRTAPEVTTEFGHMIDKLGMLPFLRGVIDTGTDKLDIVSRRVIKERFEEMLPLILKRFED